jgi:predicted nucleic-acid-binding protein
VIAVDTNLVVRLLTRDDDAQAKRAAALFRANDIWIAKTVLLESEWVLRYSYALERAAILRGILGLLGLPNVSVEDSVAVSRALQWYGDGLDLSDALHLASRGDASRFATFDHKFIKQAAPLTALDVFSP